MSSFTVLDQTEEDKLHATRLLGIEERPFKRLTKRILAPNTPIHNFLNRSQAHEAQESNRDADLTEDYQHKRVLKEIHRFREDVILDFAAFETSIARIQFLRAANEQERQRYAGEKVKIEATADDVRENISNLRLQLEAAQKTLAVRKTYDVLADKITKNPSLKPRDEQQVNIEKLKSEIEELERESLDHSQSWLDRREQLARLSDEGARLRRLIRDEKEPEKEDEVEDENMQSVDRDGDPISTIGTPRPHNEAPTPLPVLQESGGMTPRSNLLEASTPQADIAKDGDIDMTDNESGAHVNGQVSGRSTVGLDKTSDGMDTN